MELEGILGGNSRPRPLSSLFQRVAEEGDPAIECAKEALLLVADDLGNLPRSILQLGEGVAKRIDDGWDQL